MSCGQLKRCVFKLLFETGLAHILVAVKFVGVSPKYVDEPKSYESEYYGPQDIRLKKIKSGASGTLGL